MPIDDLQNSKSPMLQENNLYAACMYEIHGKDGEKEQCCILLKSQFLRASRPLLLLYEWLYFSFRADFKYFVRFENTARCNVSVSESSNATAFANYLENWKR